MVDPFILTGALGFKAAESAYNAAKNTWDLIKPAVELGYDIATDDSAPFLTGGLTYAATGGNKLAGLAVGGTHALVNNYLKGNKRYKRAEILKQYVPKFAQALGSRNLKEAPMQKAIRSIKNTDARQRKPKRKKATRATTVRNKRARQAPVHDVRQVLGLNFPQRGAPSTWTPEQRRVVNERRAAQNAAMMASIRRS